MCIFIYLLSVVHLVSELSHICCLFFSNNRETKGPVECKQPEDTGQSSSELLSVSIINWLEILLVQR